MQNGQPQGQQGGAQDQINQMVMALAQQLTEMGLDASAIMQMVVQAQQQILQQQGQGQQGQMQQGGSQPQASAFAQ